MLKKQLQYLSYIFLIVFYIFSFVSKAAMNISGGIALTISLIYIFLYDRDILKNKKYILFLLLPFIGGTFLSLFSERFLTGPHLFMNSNKFMLLFIPLAVVCNSPKKYWILLSAALISGLSAVVYSFYKIPWNHYGFVTGFLKIGRNADMMMMVSLLLASFAFSLDSKKKLLKVLSFAGFIIFSFIMFMSGIRGSMLGFFWGFSILIFISRKYNAALIMIIIVLTGLLNFPGFKNDLKSIVNLDNNRSNNARIQLLVSGMKYLYNGSDIFFGIGVSNSSKTFKEFILSHDKEFQNEYALAFNHSKDFHNSYLQLLIESGLFFLLLFLFGIFYLILSIYKNMKYADGGNKPILTASFVVSMGFLLTQFFHSELASYGSCIFYLILFGGCEASNDFINKQKLPTIIWSKVENFFPNFSHNFSI